MLSSALEFISVSEEPAIAVNKWSFLIGSWNGVSGSDPKELIRSSCDAAQLSTCPGRDLPILEEFFCHSLLIKTQSLIFYS